MKEFLLLEDFAEFLKELTAENYDIPFFCPDLVILPEAVRCLGMAFEKGSLICCAARRFCAISNLAVVNPAMPEQISGVCPHNGSNFVIKIQAFKPEKRKAV